MSKITLVDLVNLENETSAVTAINDNSATLVTAFDNTLSRDGTAPNTMQASLDMNSNQVVNLPAPATSASPLRLQDLNSFVGGGTVTNIPAGGTTNQILEKNSNTDYDVKWASAGAGVTSVGLALPVDFTVSNSPVTSTGTLTAVYANAATGSGGLVRATSPTLVTPALGTPSALVGTNVTGVPISTGVSGLSSGVATFLATPSSANLATVMSDETGTGALVFANTPTLVTPNIGAATGTSANLTSGLIGVTTNSSAGSGFIGEYITSDVPAASSLSLVSVTSKTITSISLTAGDWDVRGYVGVTGSGTTVLLYYGGGLSLTTNTIDQTLGRSFIEYVGSTATPFTATNLMTPFMPQRISLATTTTIFLVAVASFTTATCTGFGNISARRVR